MINFLTYRQVKLKKNNVAEKIAVSQNQIKDNQIKHFFNKVINAIIGKINGGDVFKLFLVDFFGFLF
jgi:hypothetical protein